MSTLDDIITYSEGTKYVCTLIAVSLFLIIAFMIGPIPIFGWRLTTGKLIILVLLGLAINKNIISTHRLSQSTPGLFSNPSFSSLKKNMLLSHTYSLLILILFIYIFISLFD